MYFKYKEKIFIFFCLILGGLYQHGYADITWNSPVVVSTNTDPVGSPQIVGDGNGNVVVMWVDKTTGYVWTAFSPAGGSQWISQQKVSKSLVGNTFVAPIYIPSIAMNVNGQGIVVYDNGQPTPNNDLYGVFFSIANGSITWGTPGTINDPTFFNNGNNHNPLVSIDNQNNYHLATTINAASGGVPNCFYVGAGSIAMAGPSPMQTLYNDVYPAGSQYPIALAVNGAGQGVFVFNANFYDAGGGEISGYGSFLNGFSSEAVYNFVNAYNGGVTAGVLAGTGVLGNSIAVMNVSGGAGTPPTAPYQWEIFFSPAGSLSSRKWNYSQVSFSTNGVPVLNVNSNGLGVIAYQNTSNNIMAQFVNLPNQIVGKSSIVGQGISPAISSDSFGDAFAAWVNPNGYLSGAWLPIGFNNWQSSSQISLEPVASGTVPAIATMNLGFGVVVYAVNNGIHSVFFTVTDPLNPNINPGNIIKRGALINGLKYNDARRQKGIQ